MRLEIRVAGFGGQGIIRTGLILAMAACIHGDKNAVQTQSYGPESRGGACKSEVVISDEEIDFPKVVDPDVLIAMSQEAYDRYVGTVKKVGAVLLDPDLVRKQKAIPGLQVFRVPVTRIAEELGKTIVANVVMLGAFASATSLMSAEALKKSVLDNVPRGTEKLNSAAFEKGYDYGKRLQKKKTEK
jgi:2-oxoglutarate ferredoxin oxidoreductase subunit gamma